MVEKTCLAGGEEERHLELLYFLLAAFNIFVLDRPPAHPPVGTPFPGGFEVEVRNGGEYLCPVREKADDVPNALCPPYCPAKQSDG